MLVMSLLRRGSARTFLLIRLRPSRDSWAIQGGLPVWFFGAASTKLSTYAISLLSSVINQQLNMEPLNGNPRSCSWPATWRKFSDVCQASAWNRFDDKKARQDQYAGACSNRQSAYTLPEHAVARLARTTWSTRPGVRALTGRYRQDRVHRAPRACDAWTLASARRLCWRA
jgi:hypothetical protein